MNSDLFEYIRSLHGCDKPWCTTCGGDFGRRRVLKKFARGRADLDEQIFGMSADMLLSLGSRRVLLASVLEFLPSDVVMKVACRWREFGIVREMAAALFETEHETVEKSRALWDAFKSDMLEASKGTRYGRQIRRRLAALAERFAERLEGLDELLAEDEAAERVERERFEAERQRQREAERQRQAERERKIEAINSLSPAERIERILSGTVGIAPPYPSQWQTLSDDECRAIPMALQRLVAQAGMRESRGPVRSLHVCLHSWRAVERRSARHKFLSTLHQQTPEQLFQGFLDGNEPIYWYPREFALWISSKAVSLSTPTAHEVIGRLGRAKRGHWGRVRRQLVG